MCCRSLLLSRRWMAAVVIALAASANAAFCQPPPPPPVEVDEPRSPTTSSAAAADLELFERLDTNEDGLLSGKEATDVLAYDANGDKRVTKAEFLAARAKARAVDPAVEDGKQFTRLDGNEDGWLSGKELKGLERYDTNADGEISKAEFFAGRAADRGASPRLPVAPAGLDSFLISVAQRDAKRMLAQMHPDLQEKVDEPVLKFFLDAIHADLGAMSDDEPADVDVDKQNVDGVRIDTTTATVEFARGSANCELVVQDGKIISFAIDSDKVTGLDRRLGDRLVKDKEFYKLTGEFYAPRGARMIELIFQHKDEQAYDMLHPEVQQQLPLEDVLAEFWAARLANGALKKIEYAGMSPSLDLETGSLKKLAVNYKLDCDNGPAEGKIVLQFVGLSGAVVGFSVNKQVEETPAQPLAAKSKTYRNQVEKLSKSHVEDFVPFTFSYPDSWELDPKAGTDQSPNVVKVMRNMDLGDDGTYTQENFAVGSCQVTGSGEVAKLGLQLLSQQFQAQVAKGFPEYKLSREGDMTLGQYAGYGFDFTSKLRHPTKDQVDCWGRIIFIAPSAIRQEHGLSIIMLATSEAPELKSLADLGVKGQLPVIINSFKVGAEEAPPIAPPIAPPAVPDDSAKAAEHYDRAVQLVDKGDLNGAIAELSEAIKLEPRNADGYVARGNVRYENKDLKGAAADYTLAIQVDAANVVAHNNRGVMYYYLDDLNAALADYERALKLDPQYALAYSNRGLIKLLRNDDAGAQRDFDKALELDPSAEFAAQQAADIREAKQRRSKAIPAPPMP
jgi:Flp pilus assembly protein TadD